MPVGKGQDAWGLMVVLEAGLAAGCTATGFLVATAFLTGVDLAGVAAFFAGATLGATGATSIFFAAATFSTGAAVLAVTVFLTVAAGFLVAAGLASVAGVTFLAATAFDVVAFSGVAVFLAVAMGFSKIKLQKALHVKNSTSSDPCCWVASSTMNRVAQPQSICEEHAINFAIDARLYSQDSAPPDWYSMTRVSKKLRSFFRSIISLIQGNGFSSFGNKASSPI